MTKITKVASYIMILLTGSLLYLQPVHADVATFSPTELFLLNSKNEPLILAICGITTVIFVAVAAIVILKLQDRKKKPPTKK